MNVLVKGDLACYTMPEAKAERMSYPVITPSSARAVVGAVFWKPEIRWVVQKIKLLKPVKYISIKTNEVGRIADGEPVDVTENRIQRVSTILKDVAYEIENPYISAMICPTPGQEMLP